MEGVVGNLLISLSFLSALGALILYGLASRDHALPVYEKWANRLWITKGLFVIASTALLSWLILTHRFEYFYVWNYTSLDLEMPYRFSALWGGQEGSFLVWILMTFLVGLALIRLTREPYRGPVLFVMALAQLFLLSMLLGWDLFGLHLGASPFRTIAQEMADAPFIQANPGFVPADGTGLNDLLKSPWMMIHPPVIFMGFAMMTVPFAFAIASLWKQKYDDWIRPALPWTLAANLSLLTAIFLGAYWAYETLSFGGYWAWDPVENASLVPWLIGTAGIHMMIIQRKSARAHKGAIFFSILAYIAVVYQTFLTRSGVLGQQSVHSFVDLGLYNQLLLFMLVILGLGIGLYLYRYKELPSAEGESAILSREFMTFTGAMLLFILGMVIILGTSSPILGRLFVEQPTPPEIQFYNDWSMPIALIMAITTVIAQFLFWKKQDAESLASSLVMPLLLTSVASIVTIVLGSVRDLYHMVYYFVGWFTVFGNGAILLYLVRRNSKLIGGALSHVGFGVLLLGILASSAYNEVMLDERIQRYNEMVLAGQVMDEQGFPVQELAETFMLELNKPKIVGGRYRVTYEGFRFTDSPRPGQQEYKIRFEPLDGGKPFVLKPDVYPMSSSPVAGMEWAVEPHVKSGLFSDIYLYVAGSAWVEEQNRRMDERSRTFTPASVGEDPSDGEEETHRSFRFEQDIPVEVGPYQFTYKSLEPVRGGVLPDSTLIAVAARLEIYHKPTDTTWEMTPLFAVYSENGVNYTWSPPEPLERFNLAASFTSIIPEEDAIRVTFDGLLDEYEEDWVVIVAEKKPFVSIVWLGTFLLMGGFTISILRHWERDRRSVG